MTDGVSAFKDREVPLRREGDRALSVGHFGKHARYAKRIWSVGGDCGGGAAVKSDKMLAATGKSSLEQNINILF